MIDPIIKIEIAECLECEQKIIFHNRPYLGQAVVCPKCQESFEVYGLDPVQLDWADDGFEYDDDYEEWA